MQSITFASTGNFPSSSQKNYVFVDEHNRHKRLKVMRACEGCRRRKIKCDAATTNTWPCSACKRLKLTCVPPTMQFDKGFQTQTIDFGDDIDEQSNGSEEDYLPPHQQLPTQGFLRRSTSTGSLPHYVGRDHFGVRPAAQLQVAPHTSFMPGLYSNPAQALPVDTSVDFDPSNLYTTPPPTIQQMPGTGASHSSWRSESPATTFNTAGVHEVLGQLKIEDTGVASYIHSQSREIAARPAVDESLDYEENPIFNPSTHDYAVRIPLEEMPTDEEADALFNIFFADVHPYLPVVNKNAFYRQWHGSRHSISPLLLEAILACAGRISNNPKVGLKWLNMASKHLDCFFDVPRISTIQALLLLLKARESAPQRGYFFRSYISIVTMMAMARDLGLDRHADLHKNGSDCLDGPVECLTKTKVWQACFMLEFMVCAPQGRHVMASDPTTIDIPASSSVLDMSEKELTIHMNFSYFVELLKLIRRINDVFSRLKATGANWAGDPEFLACGPSFDNWLYTLPQHLQIDVPTDPNMPMEQVLSHYAGNLLIYGYLARIMFHRPALAFARNFTSTGQWRMHLRACYDSSRKACRLTEAVMDQYGVRGLQCMLRGINFTIYAMLTCTMVNLVAATCPDPEFNSDAREYFSRAMRVLEVCIDISASMETRAQIEALRAAFSQDVTQPFVLNSNFPFYSSPSTHQMSPAASAASYSPVEITRSPLSSSLSAPINPSRVTISPPNSERGESPNPTLMMMQQQQNVPTVMQPVPRKSLHHGPQQEGWNPQRIFDHWSNGFPGLASAPLPPSTLPTVPENGLVEGLMPATSAYFQPSIPVVTPDVWQNTVAHVWAGTKRSWQYANQ